MAWCDCKGFPFLICKTMEVPSQFVTSCLSPILEFMLPWTGLINSSPQASTPV